MSPLRVLEAAAGRDGQAEAHAMFLVAHTSEAISPLPPPLKRGLVAIAVCGILSFVTAFSLLVYLSYMLIRWYVRPPEPGSEAASGRGEERAAETNHRMHMTDAYLCPKTADEEDKDAAAAARGTKAPSLRERLRREPPNQFLILVYNLVLADLQQAAGFTISLAWPAAGQARSGGQLCWMQGWFISVGDLGSSLFICAIAIHTYLAIIRDYRLPSWAFYLAIGLLWGLNYLAVILGIVIHRCKAAPGGLYVRVMAWCWVNTAYDDLRLGLHYAWIFTLMAITTAIYIYIFAYLHIHRNRPKTSGFRRVPRTTEGHHNPGRRPSAPPPPAPEAEQQQQQQQQEEEEEGWRHRTFLLYPVIYVLCTAPLALARARSIGKTDVSLAYFTFAGAVITLGGFLDVLPYSWTHRAIIFSPGARPPSQDLGLFTFNFMRTPPGRKLGNVVYVRGGAGRARARAGDGGGGGGGGSSGSSRDPHTGGPSEPKRSRRQQNRRHNAPGGDREAPPAMTIQCETVTSVSVQVDPDVIKISGLSLASRALSEGKACSPSAQWDAACAAAP
ncbi:hypothetical protein RB594_009225 [Gaeumannomyces avenae]